MVWFVAGNLTKDDALAIVQGARDTLKLIPVAKEDFCSVRCLAVDNGSHQRINFDVQDKKNDNSAFVSYF